MPPEGTSGRRLRFPVDLYDDESIPGAIARGVRQHVLVVTKPVFEAAAVSLRNTGLAQLATPAELERLAYVIRCDPAALSGRTGTRVEERSGKSSVHAKFGTLVIPRALLELDRRRIGPTSLLKHDYHRLHWMNLLLPYCTESLERLVDTCPSRDIKLGWRFAQGIGCCDHCGEVVPPSDAQHLPERLAEGYRFFGSLSSPDAASVAKAWSALPDPVRTVDPQGLVNLALQLGTIATGATPKQPSRFSLSAMTAEGLAESAALGAEFLRTFPSGLRDWVREADEGFGSDIQAIAKLRTRLRFLIGRFAYPGVPALIEQALPNIARYASHGLVTTKRYYLYTEVRRRLGFDHLKMANFKAHPDLVARHISAPAKRQLIQYDADYIDGLVAILQGATTARSVAQALRLPVYGVEQLCLDGLLEVEDHFVARIATDELLIRASTVTHLMSRILAIATAGAAPAGCRPLLLAADRIGGGPKPWATILEAMIGGSIPFWMARSAGDLGDVLVRPNDLAPFRRAPVELRKLPGGLSQHLSQRDAAEMLNIKPSDLVHVADALGPGADYKGRTRRSSVEALADRVAWPGEIAWHLGVAPQKVRRLMREEGIAPAATGWDRSQLREAGLLPL